MSTRTTPKRPPAASSPEIPSISEVLGLQPTLPGECADHYQQSLDAIIGELGAKTALQVYLAEKIHDCLCWIRRYEEQKRATIAVEMGYLTSNSPLPHFVRDALMQNKLTKGVIASIESCGYTLEALQQEAIENKAEFLAKLDSRIALYTKMLASFQMSYEVAANRKARAQQLTLQNELMRRRLDAIEVVAKDVSMVLSQEVLEDEQPQAN
jgi:hypothetical protein